MMKTPSGPYCVLRIAASIDINERITWDIVSYRKASGDLRGVVVVVGIESVAEPYKLDADNSISAKIMRNWREGEPSSTGISFGFKKKL